MLYIKMISGRVRRINLKSPDRERELSKSFQLGHVTGKELVLTKKNGNKERIKTEDIEHMTFEDNGTRFSFEDLFGDIFGSMG